MSREDTTGDEVIARILQEEEHNYNRKKASSSSSSAAAAPIIVDISKTPTIKDKAEIERLDRLYAEELNNSMMPQNLPNPTISRGKGQSLRGRGNNGRGRGRGGRGKQDNWNFGQYRNLYEDDEAFIPHEEFTPYDNEFIPVNHRAFLPQQYGGPVVNQLAGVNPRMLELMTRDINANDYELLLDTFGGDQENRNKGATDAEIDTFLINITHQQKRKSKNDVIDLCGDIPHNKRSKMIVLIDDDDNKKENDKENECSICLSQFAVGEELSILPCLHKFHKTCITNWLKISKKCPIDNVEF